MTASNLLRKKNQENFLLSNFREFYKLWHDNQEANLKVNCCEGKLTISFESSFTSPESKPTLPSSVKEKVKKISPSRRKRNQARAELFRRSKASKGDDDEVPESSKEGQEAMQVSISNQEADLEKLPTAVEPDLVVEEMRNHESNSSLCSMNASLIEIPRARIPAQSEEATEDLPPPVSRAKNKKGKNKKGKNNDAALNGKPAAVSDESVSEAIRIFEEDVLENVRASNDTPDLVKDDIIDSKWLERCIYMFEFMGSDDPHLFTIYDYVSKLAKDGGRKLYELEVQGILDKHKYFRSTPSVVSSYKNRSSAKKVSKGKKKR